MFLRVGSRWFDGKPSKSLRKFNRRLKVNSWRLLLQDSQSLQRFAAVWFLGEDVDWSRVTAYWSSIEQGAELLDYRHYKGD